jgi:hypothetical protein
MTVKRQQQGGHTHAKKETARTPRDAGRQTTDTCNSTAIDPVAGWYALAKPARMNRQQKRTRKRKAGGAIDLQLAALLILIVVAAVMMGRAR